MPKKKREKPDRIDVEILTALYYLGEGTVYQLEKVTGIPKATISDRLKWLEEKGYLERPREEVSKGKFKKVYTAPDKEKIIQAIMESENIKSLNRLEDRFVRQEIYSTLGYDLADFKDWSEDEIGMFDDTLMFVWEYLGLLEIRKEGDEYLFKLTEKGIRIVIETFMKEAEIILTDLRDFDLNAYLEFLGKQLERLKERDKKAFKNFISKFCKTT